ncbi:GNAT family N-acetyltransferase [Brevibacillus choshinensis]|uniref:GNAT family N-acetyltransferase n=1 Tax=Brevibacillus choshinensis TaxID=54911 RepID=A0ABX7FLT2_BRECH|nr:GNAT family N-acetyltransferase [Brevibacillus choshinensis]QRG65950.1 GNAT family N-acetyltransferase [Brevibacillus choshinensis]
MIYLETVNDPISQENVQIHKSILNSHPSYNLVVVGKEFLTDEGIMTETSENLKMGEKTLHIKQDDECIGIITYLPESQHVKHTWIGLFAIHKNDEGGGVGTKAWGLFEQILLEQSINRVRLLVQNGNDRGASFWSKNGFVKINSQMDEHKNMVDVLGKQLS